MKTNVQPVVKLEEFVIKNIPLFAVDILMIFQATKPIRLCLFFQAGN
jgi:hypothetical protein